jgi:hypothetical protein
VTDAATLAGAIELLERARQLWTLIDDVRTLPPIDDA